MSMLTFFIVEMELRVMYILWKCVFTSYVEMESYYVTYTDFELIL